MPSVQEEPGVLHESSGGPYRVGQAKAEGGINMDPGREKQGKLLSQTEIKIGKPKGKIIIQE